MKIKKYVLWISFILLAFVFVAGNPITFGLCKNITEYGTDNRYCSETIFEIPEGVLLLGLFIGGLTLFFSLLTYKMKDQVFQAWWGFARWFVPLIIVSTLLLETGIMGGGGGWGIGSGIVEFTILFLLYLIFILVSLIRIIWAYIKTRNI